MKIKAVVFDYGGVIELYGGGNVLKGIVELINVSMPVFKEEYFKHNHLSNVENLPWEDTIMKVVSRFTKSETIKKEVKSFIKSHKLKKKINTELLELFPIFRKQGLKVAIFSNNTTKLRDRAEANGLLKLIDELVISAEIGFQKPHKEAFDILFERLKLEPEEVVFIDDTSESLKKANEIGYIPILFKNNYQLKVDLRKLGVII